MPYTNISEETLAEWREGGLVTGKKWNTVNDDLVCPMCSSLHGQVVKLHELFRPYSGLERLRNALFEGGFDEPPAHEGCRCWLSPKLPELQEPSDWQFKSTDQLLRELYRNDKPPRRWWQFWK